jgi:hypothetical protein
MTVWCEREKREKPGLKKRIHFINIFLKRMCSPHLTRPPSPLTLYVGGLLTYFGAYDDFNGIIIYIVIRAISFHFSFIHYINQSLCILLNSSQCEKPATDPMHRSFALTLNLRPTAVATMELVQKTAFKKQAQGTTR